MPIFSVSDPCDPGYYSDTGYQECIFCPQHFYQPSSGQTTCLECASDEITEENIPYTSSSDCLDGGKFTYKCSIDIECVSCGVEDAEKPKLNLGNINIGLPRLFFPCQ